MKQSTRVGVFLSAFVLLAAAACTTPPAGGTNNPPIAVVTATPTSGLAPLTVNFDALGSSDPGGAIASYSWTFGDGGTATGPQPSYIYAADGTYTATVTVTDNGGLTSTATKVITVGAPNAAPLAVAGVSPGSGPAPLEVTFSSTGSVDNDGSIVSYAWVFGDGGTSTAENPIHTYTTPGNYSAELTVTDDDGATGTDTVTVTVNANQPPTAVAGASVTVGKAPLSVVFSSAGSGDTDGTIASTTWAFGDGGTSTQASPTHVYNVPGPYTAVLTVTDDLGATATASVNIVANANQAPTAVANATPAGGQAPLIVNFSSASSADSDGTIVSRSWNFGDGNGSSAANPQYTYSAAGTYDVTLTITDDNGATDTDTLQIVVSPVPNVPPTAVLDATPTSGKRNLTVAFSSAGSSDSDGTITSRAWTFGDGGTSTTANPSHTYLVAGTYTATLTVTDNAGGIDTKSVIITVTPNQPPTAAATATPSTRKVGQSVAFSSVGSGDIDGTIASYAWVFGDGGTSASANPSHTYTAPGTYVAELTVTDDTGDTATATANVTVLANQPPVAAANATPQSGARPLVVAFNSGSSTDPDGTIVSRSWAFGTGDSSTQDNPSYTYTAAGSYTAVLTVTDDNGATSTASVAISVVIDDDADGVSPPADCDDNDPTIKPGAPDPLDLANVDSNCDGADGVVASISYVRATGGDTSTCGTLVEPCASIGQGELRAQATGKTFVLVAGGNYGRFGVIAGLEIRGGFGQNFLRGGGATGSTTTTVNGSYDLVSSLSQGILADSISTPTTIADLTVVGANESANGRASYGIVIRNSTSALTLSGVSVVGGTGGAGTAGTNGTSASQATPGDGQSGENSEEVGSAPCLGRYNARKSGGTGAGGGGTGGQGGQQDSGCFSYGATAGLGGANASPGGATGGGGGAAQGGTGSPGNPGSNGTNQTGGAAGTASAGLISGGQWVPAATAVGGNPSGTPTAGNPGGGGGGGGGSDNSNDDMGAGGGGGAAGGQPAAASGTGGTAGRASIAVFALNSSPTLTGVQITLGTGGTGGAGGSGGLGQPGGTGGAGGLGNCSNNDTYSGYPRGTCPTGGDGGAGGKGGNGGAGGARGAGGGGAGGPSIGLLLSSSSTTGAPSYNAGGAGGGGGAGGTTGVSGATGQVGTKVNSVTL